MVDTDLILAKAGSVRKYLGRIDNKRHVDFQTFASDVDRQDVIMFNLQLAIQNCADIAAHIVSDEGMGMPATTNEMFYLLEENGYLDRNQAEKMVKAAGLRNLIVHEYGRLDLKRIYDVVNHDMADLNQFLAQIFDSVGIKE
mgnify:CR=1 FL=1